MHIFEHFTDVFMLGALVWVASSGGSGGGGMEDHVCRNPRMAAFRQLR